MSKIFVFTGGGGYTVKNVSRCWCYETAIAVGTEIPDELPHNDYSKYFKPITKLHIKPEKVTNNNTLEYLDQCIEHVYETLRNIQPVPSVQFSDIPPILMTPPSTPILVPKPSPNPVQSWTPSPVKSWSPTPSRSASHLLLQSLPNQILSSPIAPQICNKNAVQLSTADPASNEVQSNPVLNISSDNDEVHTISTDESIQTISTDSSILTVPENEFYD